MRAFYDTEYAQHRGPPYLASIGIVRDDGRELYLVSAECKRRKGGSWFRKNVWPLIENAPKHSLESISERVSEFLIPVYQIVTKNGDTDRRLLEQLIGPLWFEHYDLGGKKRSDLQSEIKHHALADARYHRQLFYSTRPR